MSNYFLKTILVLSFLFFSIFLFSQSPQLMAYQAVACDANGIELTDQNLGVRYTIIKDDPSGTPVYLEAHDVLTDEFGLFTANIGDGGINSTGNFSGIDWGTGIYFLKVELDVDGNGSFTTLSTSQLLSVPYALHADHSSVADSAANDMDTDPMNEIQTLDYSNGELSISNGNSFSLNLDDADSDPTNEIQTLTFEGDSIKLNAPDGSSNGISLYQGYFSKPGASFDYPQGLYGEYVTIVDANYTVPNGKTLYVTAASRLIEAPAFSDFFYVAPSMPVFSGGTILRDCKCSGFLLDQDPDVEVVLIDFNSISTYLVPSGKTLILKSGFNSLENLELVVNDVEIRYESPNGIKSSHALIFTEGTRIELFRPDRGILYTGYLINNN